MILKKMNKQRTKGSHIVFQKMIVDNRDTKPGNWIMFSIYKAKRNLFKYKKFERVSAYSFFPFYCELSNRSKIYGINLFLINFEIHRHL